MVARHVRMQVLPNPFYPVVVRTVGGQKMQSHATSKMDERNSNYVAAMNLVVVQDDVDHPSVGVHHRQRFQHFHEQPSVFLLRFDPMNCLVRTSKAPAR